jgi:thiamine transporter ThiT
MKPTTVIYWTRAFLGVVAGLLSTLLSAVGGISFLNGLSIALLVYIVTYYVYKSLFLTKVEKPSKIYTTGIGAYFLTWIVAWAIFYTLLRTPP